METYPSSDSPHTHQQHAIDLVGPKEVVSKPSIRVGCSRCIHIYPTSTHHHWSSHHLFQHNSLCLHGGRIHCGSKSLSWSAHPGGWVPSDAPAGLVVWTSKGGCCWWLLLPKITENIARKFAKVFEGLVHHVRISPLPFHTLSCTCRPRWRTAHPAPYHSPHGHQSTWFTDNSKSPVCLTQPHLESDGSSDADAHLGPAWDHKIWGHSPSSVCPRPRWRSLLHHLGAALNPHHHVETRSGSRRRGGHPIHSPDRGKGDVTKAAALHVGSLPVSQKGPLQEFFSDFWYIATD